jgi:seryl-tRNA synthetase
MTGDLSTFGIPAAMVGQADGSILVPRVLQPYLGGLERLALYGSR